MNKRGEIKPRDIVVSFGLFALVIFSVVWLIGGVSGVNTSLIDAAEYEGFNNTVNEFNEYTATIEELETKTRNFTASEGGAFSFLNNLINQGWQTLRLMWQSFSFIGTAINNLGTMFGVPNFAVVLLVAILIAIFVFAVLSVIFGRNV